MALQAGELFASFTIDTRDVDRAVQEIESKFDGLMKPGVTESIAASLQQAAERGMAAMGGVISAGSGHRLGAALGLGIAVGLGQQQGAVLQAAEAIGRAAADAMRSALQVTMPLQGAVNIPAAQGGSMAEREIVQGGRAFPAENMDRQAAAYAKAVASALSGVRVQLDGNEVGSLVAPAVSRTIARSAAARRYGAL